MLNFLKLCLLTLIYTARKSVTEALSINSRFDSLDLVCPSYSLVHGNLSTAGTIFLAEIHARGKESIECIEGLTRFHQHIVFFEGFDNDPIVKCDSFANDHLRVKPGRICSGWDNEDALKKGFDLFDKWEKLTANEHKKRRTIEKKLKTIQIERNRALAASILIKPRELLGIVILGKAHLFKTNEPFGEDSGASIYLKKFLEDNKDENPYAILDMIEDTASLDEQDKLGHDSDVCIANTY